MQDKKTQNKDNTNPLTYWTNTKKGGDKFNVQIEQTTYNMH